MRRLATGIVPRRRLKQIKSNIVPDCVIEFAVIREGAIIPSKRNCDFGYDLYACFDQEQVIIKPGEIKIISTGIISAFSENYGCLIEERGSTGTKGLAVRAGVFDSNYRGEWLVPINNTTEKMIVICKDESKVRETADIMYYPYKKAIAQVCFFVNPRMKVVERSEEEILGRVSVRGEGRLGSSGK